MKRHWAVILIAVFLAGCRSAQPTTNPFMQTTVPPPGTAPGMMVMPGEPMPVPTAPVVTTPAPVAPAVPVNPNQQAPLITAPPPLGPTQEFHPPGGSYLFRQSSNDPPSGAADNGIRLASASEPVSSLVGDTTNQVRFSSAPVATPTEQRESITLATGAATGMTSLRMQPQAADRQGDPPELRTQGQWHNAVRVVESPQQNPGAAAAALSVGSETASNSARLVGQATPSATHPPSAADEKLLRLTAGASPAEVAVAPSQPGASTTGSSASRIAIVASSGAVSPAAATASAGAGSNAAATAFQPVIRPDYYHAPDYRTLRGRLEYSQSRRQWKLRYIPIDGRTDAYGGSVVLTDSPALAAYQPGDFVTVRGRLAADASTSGAFSPQFELEAVESHLQMAAQAAP